MGMFDDLVPQPGTAQSPPRLSFDDLVPPPAKAGAVEDVAKSAGAGYLRGVAGLVGAPALVGGLAQSGVDWLQSKTQGVPFEEMQARNASRSVIPPGAVEAASPSGIVRGLESLGGTLHKPQTVAGEYAGTVAEFLPGAALGPGNVARNAAIYGVAPALASETAGQVTKGTALEPYARGGAALATAGVGAFASRPNAAGQTVARATEGVTPAQIDAMESLIADARARGVDLSRAEALAQVTGGATDLPNLQRVVEGQGGLREFYANRPAQIEAAGRQAVGEIAPQAGQPAALGQEVQAAARGAIARAPESQAFDQAQWAAGPRVTPEQAGQVIQPELRRAFERREGMRNALANRDYAAARNTASDVPVGERMVDVSRTVHDPVSVSDLPPIPSGVGPAASTAGGPAPVPLSRYIAQNGGLPLTEGEAAAAGFDEINIPFAGRLAHEKGRPIDGYWREKLIEDGYLPPDPDGGMSRDIRGELFKALHDERAGKPTFSVYDADRVGARGDAGVAAENARGLDGIKSDIVRQHVAAGMKPSDLRPDLVDRAAAAIHNGHETDPITAYERAATQSVQATSERMVPREVTETIPQTIYGQVNANPVVSHIDAALETAKGAPRTALQMARKALHKTGGELDSTVAGLDSSRKAIADLIDKAKRAGANNSAREMEGTLAELDRVLEQVPEYERARRGFEAASAPLSPFGETRAPGKIVSRDQYEQRFELPPEKAPALIDQGPSAARDFREVASGPAREAYEGHLTTRLLDSATDASGNVSADAIRLAIRNNEDVLNQFPGVRDRLQGVAVARDGLARVEQLPVGRLAERPDVKKAINLLFPANPLPGSAPEIQSAIGALSASNPMAARQLVRAHAESVFNEATQALQGGPNQFGGATFAAVIKGNRQQAENLAAAISALPGGEQILPGFDRFLDIMSATGQRQRIGSQTAFNTEALADLKKGGTVGTVAALGAGGGLKAPAKVLERFQEWNMGRNVDQIARILVDPEAATLFRHLATTDPTSTKAAALLARLTAIGIRSGDRPPTQTNQR
jgi:hypothetical protein